MKACRLLACLAYVCVVVSSFGCLGATGTGTLAEVAVLEAADSEAVPEPASTTRPASGDVSPPQLSTAAVSLRQCLEWALQYNLRLSVERLTPDVRDAQVVEALSAFDALFTGGYTYDHDEEEEASGLSGLGSLTSETSAGQFGLQKRLRTGAQARVGLDWDHVGTNSPFAMLNPRTDANVVVGLTQPLLRGGGVGVNTAAIRIARNARRGSVHLFRKSVEDTLAAVEEVYWTLYLSIESVRVRQRQLERAKDRLKQARLFVEAGRAAPVEVVSAEAEVAAIQTDIIIAENNVRRAEDALKRLINRPDLPVGARTRLVPADAPGDRPVEVDVPRAVATALANRPDLKAAELDQANADITRTVARHERLPRLDLSFEYRLHGLDRRLENSLEELSQFEFDGRQVALTLQIPLGNRAAKSRYDQARLVREQTQRSISDLRQQIALEIKRIADDLRRDRGLITTARKAKDLANREYLDEKARYESQRSTRVDLLQAQTRLVARELEEIRAVVGFNVDLARLHRLQGTYLEHHKIEITAVPGD